MRKILIIKLGYTEILDRMLSFTTSLGEILRTTFILHYFKKDYVVWLVDEKAVPLLKNNEYINEILVYNSKNIQELKNQTFDVIINLEKMPQVCELLKFIKAKERLGFGYANTEYKDNECLSGKGKLIEISKSVEKRKNNKDSWQQILAEAIGKQWEGETYILGYKPNSKIKYDVGFNWTTSNKWSNKAWPKKYWKELEGMIKDKYTVSWQQGMANLYEYMDWINSCKMIVSADTLGLHLAIALKKKIVALFGPTPFNEVYLYNLGVYLLPQASYDCIPCYLPVCKNKKQCMEYIYPYMVKQAIYDGFKKNTYSG